MSLLNQLIKESAAAGATSAGGVANSRDTLFSGEGDAAKGVTRMMKRMGYVDVSNLPSNKNKKKWLKMVESTAYGSEMKPYDYNEVLSKLDQAAKTAKGSGEDVAVFGVEDDEGSIVKIYIPKDQAAEFEAALAGMLAGESDMSPTGEYEAMSSKDIAEIIFDLKTKFDIIDADWGEIQGTEEEEDADINPGAGEEVLDDESEEGPDEEEMDEEDPTEEKAMSALQSVISALQADAEAKQADAQARKAEAEASIAKSAADAAMSKVKQEEDILDMERHEKAKKDAKKEAETLAKLAAHRKEMSDDESNSIDGADAFASPEDIADFENSGGEDVPAEEEEEIEKTEITKDKLIDLIYKSLSAN